MKKSVSFDIDEDIANKAEAIYNAVGMDTEMALSMFMRRTVIEGALPMPPIGHAAQAFPATKPQEPSSSPLSPVTPAKQASGGKITQDMADAVWGAFLDMHRWGGSASDYADEVAESSGMNAGSAFIYLVMLDNMIAGKPNTRNMKIKDLTEYVMRIKNELGQSAYGNALASLRSSLEYWNDPKFGHFAARIQKFLDEQGSTPAPETKPTSQSGINTSSAKTEITRKHFSKNLKELGETTDNPTFARRLASYIKNDLKNPEVVAKQLSNPAFCSSIKMHCGRMPVLKKIATSVAAKKETHISGRRRYYDNVTKIGDDHYIVTNNWYQGENGNKALLVSWLADCCQEK